MSKLEHLQTAVREGKKVVSADLANCDLDEFPLALLLPLKETIEMINLGGNSISSLPDEIVQFTKLRILFFADNKFVSFPTILGSMPSLYMVSFKSNLLEDIPEEALSPSIHWLILTNNKLKRLPASIGALTNLRKFLLSGNQLECLPEEMKGCQNLELIRLSVNNLRCLPLWLLQLPKLSWIAFSSNSFQNHREITSSHIPWGSLVLKNLLGEGASGEIYRGEMMNGDGKRN
jgi:Leucine-rich repeat (LRR) protein